MIYKHNLFEGLFGLLHAVHGFYFGCRNALGLIATYTDCALENVHTPYYSANSSKFLAVQGFEADGSITESMSITTEKKATVEYLSHKMSILSMPSTV